MNASMTLKPGNVFSVPQRGHRALENEAAVAVRASGDFMRDDQVAALVLGHDLGSRADHRRWRLRRKAKPQRLPTKKRGFYQSQVTL
jgi:hypothetical protein